MGCLVRKALTMVLQSAMFALMATIALGVPGIKATGPVPAASPNAHKHTLGPRAMSIPPRGCFNEMEFPGQPGDNSSFIPWSVFDDPKRPDNTPRIFYFVRSFCQNMQRTLLTRGVTYTHCDAEPDVLLKEEFKYRFMGQLMYRGPLKYFNITEHDSFCEKLMEFPMACPYGGSIGTSAGDIIIWDGESESSWHVQGRPVAAPCPDPGGGFVASQPALYVD